ncbi:imidazoleglycerol-phosphate dehydratase HisB [bacterium]|nr:imidazoleglycerol-phosphate dehydratase HisB [bacterium]
MKKNDAKILRKAVHSRKTNETDIKIKLDLDLTGKSRIKTGIGFFDHMLEQLAKHSNIYLEIKVKGDLYIDEHHSVEDVGIALGEALSIALGDRRGIERFGFMLPMDDALAQCAIDLGGRSYLSFDCKFKRDKVGEFPTELFKEFFRGLSIGLRANIHIKAQGENDHHKAEAIFKAFARALNNAFKFDSRNMGSLPSTKGLI